MSDTCPADRIAKRFRSHAALGRVAGVSRNTARNWKRIPTEHQGVVMAAGRDLDPPIEWWEMTMMPDEALALGHISAKRFADLTAEDDTPARSGSADKAA